MSTIKLSPPWVEFYNQVAAMFNEDPDVKVGYDEESKTINMFVDDQNKADALKQLLPAEKKFGNIVVVINVVPANKTKEPLDLFAEAFKNNPVFSRAVKVGGIGSNDYNFVEFRAKVCQYWNDNLGDLNGNKSILYQDLAREIFECPGILFCTEAVDKD